MTKVSMDGPAFKALVAKKSRYEISLQEIVVEWELHHDDKPATALYFYLVAKAALGRKAPTRRVSSASEPLSTGGL